MGFFISTRIRWIVRADRRILSTPRLSKALQAFAFFKANQLPLDLMKQSFCSRSFCSRWFSLSVFSILIATSCASTGYEETSAAFETSGNLETVVILGSNDIHGALAPEKMKTRDPSPVDYMKGGASIFAAQVRVLKKKFGAHLLLLDAGDQMQGSIDSNLEEGRPMIRFFNELGYTAAVIGNHEFDFGPVGSFGSFDAKSDRDPRGTLKERIGEAKYPYLAANILNAKTKDLGIPGTRASILVNAGRLKVGIVGLTTLDTPTATRPPFVKGLEFKDMEAVALTESKKLRDDGADIVVLLAHAGVFCNIPLASDRGARTGIVKAEHDFQTGCQSEQEIPQLLRKLPKGTFDGVVSGHTHSVVHHWVEGVPVIQGGTRNSNFNLIYLTYDHATKKVIPSKTRIEGPIPICAKIFANQKNCNGEIPAPPQGRGKLQTPKLHGVEIHEDASMESILSSTFKATEAKKAEVVGNAVREIPHLRNEESPLGNLVADALRDSVGAQIGLMNPGGVRADWENGFIRYSDVFRTLPFDNSVSKLTLTGKELRLLVRIMDSGARAFASTSGLKVRVIRREDEPNSSDLDGNRKIEAWELNRLIELTLADGTPIDDHKTYTVATIDFLVSGGDSLGWFMNRVPKNHITLMAGPVLRDAVITYVKKRAEIEGGGLNSEKYSLVDANHPRLILDKRPAGRSSKGKTKSSRRRRRR